MDGASGWSARFLLFRGHHHHWLHFWDLQDRTRKPSERNTHAVDSIFARVHEAVGNTVASCSHAVAISRANSTSVCELTWVASADATITAI